jgi:hypothetical protein
MEMGRKRRVGELEELVNRGLLECDVDTGSVKLTHDGHEYAAWRLAQAGLTEEKVKTMTPKEFWHHLYGDEPYANVEGHVLTLNEWDRLCRFLDAAGLTRAELDKMTPEERSEAVVPAVEFILRTTKKKPKGALSGN